MTKMKKVTIYLMVALFAIVSCKKTDDPTPPDSTNNGGSGGTTSSKYKWEYKIDIKSRNMAVDQNDNAYFVADTDGNDNYAVISVNKNGTQNWKANITGFPTTSCPQVMLAGDKIVVMYSWDKVYCFNTNDGSQAWELTSQDGFQTMAYSNNTVYITEYSLYNKVFKLSAISASTGIANWQNDFNALENPKISINNNIICIAAKNADNYPRKFGVKVFKDNGSSCDSLWSIFREAPNNQTCSPHKAIFDGQGNLFIEDETSNNTVVYSYNETTGIENWNTQIKNIGLASDLAMIYTNGTLIATYRSDDSWAIENSFAVIDATNGTLNTSVEIGIQSEDLFTLTGSNTIITYVTDDNGIHLKEYNTDGTLLNTTTPDYAQGIVLASFRDIKINSDGDLYILTGEYLHCAEHSFTQAPSSTWASINGNNANTNSFN